MFEKAGSDSVNGSTVVIFQVVNAVAAVVSQAYIRSLFAVFCRKDEAGLHY